MGNCGRATGAPVPRLILTERAVADVERCRTFLAERDHRASTRAAAAIADALRRLTATPAMGRPVGARPPFRELVIPFGTTGYVALYVHDAEDDAVVILALRHQREAGY
ncbi:type II toxin-antitoxin system RelE/ParE family toxin [uncultured Sphingomonas sp.]|uniref:type II toxin-antitoxin system RelE/ParE family toxin n=1 Tax=uncultured Sphingomonas sp. TaxID=158754 RepID=UPI0025E0431A|nr:type II toxin-antitoxin system RelE/ParE family toxin [uncultured Sphingomonas sp.]